MSTRPWRSGWCSPGNPPASHERCDDHPRSDGKPCRCECHEPTHEKSPGAAPDAARQGEAQAMPDQQTKGGTDIKPGLHFDLPESEYHSHPTSLSQSGIKVLLESPARFDYERRHPTPPTKAMELGTIAHTMRLGVGAGVEVIEADSWRTKAANEAADKARAEGKVPLLTKDYRIVCDMAEAAERDPVVKALLSGGQPEVSAFWPDEETGVMRRGRFDYVRDDMLVDYKSAANASPRSFGRTAYNFGYFIQHPYYVDLANDCDLPGVRSLVFLVQDKRPPYSCAAIELDADAVQLGRERAAKALRIFRDCTDSGVWPSWTDVDPNRPITSVSLPGYAFFDQEPAA